jgi:hypothetical protein
MSQESGVRSQEEEIRGKKEKRRKKREECLIRLVNYQILKIKNLGFL